MKEPTNIISDAAKAFKSLISGVSKELSQLVSTHGISYVEPFWKNNPQLRRKTDAIMDRFKNSQKSVIEKGVSDAWNLANKEMNTLVIDYLKKRDALELISGKSYEDMDEWNLGNVTSENWLRQNVAQLHRFQSRTTNGMGLSERVWNNTEKAKEMLEATLSSGILEGRPAAEMATILKESLINPNALYRRVRNEETGKLELSKPAKDYHPGQGVYRSAFQNAYRLARTEVNMAFRTAENERLNQLPFVTGYRVNLSNAHPTPDICDHMKGDYPKNFVFIGWHPSCICYTTTIMLSDAKFKNFLKTGVVESENYLKTIPAGATQYIKDNQKKIDKMATKPFWFTQNSDIITKKETKKPAPPVKIETKKLLPKKPSYNSVSELETIAQKYGNMVIDVNFSANVNCDSNFNKVWQESMEGLDLDNFLSKIKTVLDKNRMQMNNVMLYHYSSGETLFGFMASNANGEKIKMSRVFSPSSKKEVEHSLFTMDKALQGKGLSKDLFKIWHNQYKEMGIRKINLHANLSIGGYAWGKYGFSIKVNSVKTLISKTFPVGNPAGKLAEKIFGQWKASNPNKDYFPMNLFSNVPDFKKYLLGSDWHGILDMNDKTQLQIFEDYLYGKK